MSNQDDFQFEGFDIPGTTPVPDVVFDKLLSRLTGNELKVLLYIIRRTYGFGKNADAISLSQFREGIKTRDENGEEKILDEGCGIGHNRTILVALASLEQKGCVTSKKRNTNAGDSDTTIYKLRFKSTSKKASKAQSDNGVVTSGNHVVTPGNEGGYSTSPRWLPEVTTVVTSGNTQETVLQYTDKQETVLQKDTFGASLDSAALTQLQNENASIKAQLEQALKQIEAMRNTPPSDTPLTPAGNSTVPDGGNALAQEPSFPPSSTFPENPEPSFLDTAIPEPPSSTTDGPAQESPTMPRSENAPSESPHSATESPSTTQADGDTSRQARGQEQQGSGVSDSQSTTTKKKPELPAGPPVMPGDDAIWNAETIVQIHEAHQGRRYPNGAKRKSDRIRDKELGSAQSLLAMSSDLWTQNTSENRQCLLDIIIRLETRHNNWWIDTNGHVMPHQLVDKDRIHMINDEIKRQRPANVTPMPQRQQQSSTGTSSFRAPTGLVDKDEMNKLMDMDPEQRKAYMLAKKQARLAQEQQQRAVL